MDTFHAKKLSMNNRNVKYKVKCARCGFIFTSKIPRIYCEGCREQIMKLVKDGSRFND